MGGLFKNLLTLIRKLFKKPSKQVVNKGKPMLKNITKLEHKVGDRAYHLLCEMDSPIGDVKEALHQFMGHLEFLESKHLSEKPQDPPQEEPPKSEEKK